MIRSSYTGALCCSFRESGGLAKVSRADKPGQDGPHFYGSSQLQFYRISVFLTQLTGEWTKFFACVSKYVGKSTLLGWTREYWRSTPFFASTLGAIAGSSKGIMVWRRINVAKTMRHE